MVKPDRLSMALNGPRAYPRLVHGLDSRLTFRKLRRPTPLPAIGQSGGPLARCLDWVLGGR